MDFVLFLQKNKSTFGSLFLSSLKEYGILCIGLHRKFSDEKIASSKRYVITNPSHDFLLVPTDVVSEETKISLRLNKVARQIIITTSGSGLFYVSPWFETF